MEIKGVVFNTHKTAEIKHRLRENLQESGDLVNSVMKTSPLEFKGSTLKERMNSGTTENLDDGDTTDNVEESRGQP